MRAVLCQKFEGAKALSLGDAVEPQPAADEVLIDVHAASVSYMDYLMSCGGYQIRPPLPYIPGTDAAGVVVAVGANVTRFCPGDRVACGGWYGGFAERMTAKASKSAKLECAVERRRFPVGVSPTRQPLQPEATGAAMEVTKWLKPSGSVSRNTVTARVCRP